MNARLHRRMAMSRAMLNRRPLPVGDDPALRARARADVADRLRAAREDLLLKRHALQTAWQHYCELDAEQQHLLLDEDDAR